MASGSGPIKAFGSTAPLHTLCGDTIPKEYHRKVLKKIAQLTKVVYSLHTKNDENEERIEALTAEHSKERQELVQKCVSRTEEWEGEKNKNKDLEERLANLRTERTALTEEHGAFVVDAEQRLQSVKEHHLKQLNALNGRVSTLEELLCTKEKETIELQTKLNDSVDKLVKNKSKMEKEIENLKKRNEATVEEFQKNVKSLKTTHELSVAELIKKHEDELESLKDFLSNQRDSVLQAELQRLEEKNQRLEQQMSLKQSGLLDRVSDLSSELKKVRDELVLTQQRERDMEKALQEKTIEEQENKRLLEKEKESVSGMERKLKDLEINLSVLAEQRELQNEQLKTKAVYISELEAVKVHLEKQSCSLNDQLGDVTKRLRCLEEEKMREREGYTASSSETAQRIHALEQQLDKVFQEKKQLHAQYAHEIEAAHAQLSENEASLNEEHAKTIQLLKDNHKTEMEAFDQEKKNELESLKNEYKLQLSIKESSLSQEHNGMLSELSAKLSNKNKEASDLKDKLSRLESLVSKRDNELRTADASINKLREELMAAKNGIAEIQKQRDALEAKVSQIQTSLNVLSGKYDHSLKTHKEELARTERRVRKDTEDLWKSKLQSELMSLREEMDKHYSENNKTALNKMTELKDSAMREVEGKWTQERKEHLQQVKLLQKQLQDLKYSSEAALQQARAEHQQQTDELKFQFNQELSSSSQWQEKLVSDHTRELEKLKVLCQEDKQRAIRDLNEVHTREMDKFRQANQLAIASLKDNLLKNWEREREELEKAHQHQLGDLQDKFALEFDSKLEDAKLHYDKEMESKERRAQERIDSLNKEISDHKNSMATLSTQLANCKSALTKEKEKLALMIIELNDKKKQLKVNEQEIQMIVKEARDHLRAREEHLNSTHQADTESIICQHKHQSQMLLNEFNRAKELLSQKLHATEKRLHESELKYKNREPRPEDVASIRELMAKVKVQEGKIKDLITEKKVFQLELMNRERNYNKLFSANPQIGVLDPLKGKKKTMDTLSLSPPAGMRYYSSTPSFVPGTNSLPAIKPLSTVDHIDHLHSQSVRPSPLHDHLTPSFNSLAAVPNDFELPGLISSPKFQSRQPHEPDVGISSPISTKRSLKFLSSSRNEMTGRSRTNSHHKNNGNSVQTFPSNAHSILA